MPGDLLFRRLARVVLATPTDFLRTSSEVAVIEGLRVAFKVTKTSGKEPNTGEVTITNLAPATRARLKDKGVKFWIEAGYEGAGVEQVFVGDARTIDHDHDGPNVHTKLKGGDGERALRHARTSVSFKGGTTIGEVALRLGRDLGVGLGNLPTVAAGLRSQFAHGFVAHGTASQELDRILRAAGYSWSIQDGALLVQRDADAGAIVVPELSATSGLVGAPEWTAPEKKGGKAKLKVKCLLRPVIKPGSRVVVKGEATSGTFKVGKVEHDGDTMGGDWYTTFEGTPT